MKKAIILGAGVTGLRCAEELANKGYKVIVVEKSGKVGGMASSFSYKDFILDYGPHKFYTQLPGINEDFKRIVGSGNYYTVQKKNSIRLLGRYFDFPVKLGQLATNIPLYISMKIFFDLMKAQLVNKKPTNYADYFRKGFGATGYNLIFRGFAEKVWGDPESLAVELGYRRSPAKSIFDVIKTALIRPNKNVSAESFLYPKFGYGIISDNLAKNIQKQKGKLYLNAQVQKIYIKNKRVVSVDIQVGKKKKNIACDVCLSTLAINDLITLLSPRVSPKLIQESKKLAFRSLIIAYIFLNKSRALKDNWLFFPEKEFCFNRVAEQKSFSPDTCPKDRTVITAEVTCSYGDEVYNAPDAIIRERVIADLEKAGLIQASEVIDFFTRKAGRVYPVYTRDYKASLNQVLAYLDSIKNIYSLGRLGLFNYNNADHCLDMAKVTADIIIREKPLVAWQKARDYFDTYRIVD